MTNSMEYKYKLSATNKFKKDLKLMKKRNNFDIVEFEKVIDILLKGDELPIKYCNHILEPKSERIIWMSYKTRLVTCVYD